MTIYSCLVIDDEPLALKMMENYIHQTPFLSLKKSCNNALDALEVINKEDVDIVFSDIQMPGLNGLQLANLITEDVRSRIQWIFTTAYDQYAIEGYKVDAIGYLLKPIGYDDFLKVALKAKQNIDKKYDQSLNKSNELFLNVKVDYKFIRLSIDDIIMVEALKDYAKIYLNDNSTVLVLSSLKAMETKLPVNQFVRIHRSFIIHKKYIQFITKSSINMGIAEILVGDMYKEAFKSILDEWAS